MVKTGMQLGSAVPLTPDDPLPDLERCLADLHDLGPMEYLPGEREMIEHELQTLNRLSHFDILDP